jgi:Icc protein
MARLPRLVTGSGSVRDGTKEGVRVEITSVSFDEVEAFVGSGRDGVPARVLVKAEGGSDLEVLGVRVSLLPAPKGRLLSRFFGVNDVHIGETECGKFGDPEIGPILTSAPGEPPYYRTMAESFVGEVRRACPEAVFVRGDLTAAGADEDLEEFWRIFKGCGVPVHAILGNHDVETRRPEGFERFKVVDLPGVRVVLLDTTVVGRAQGALTQEALDGLMDAAKDSSDPVIVMGHHHPWSPDSHVRATDYFGINPDDSEKLVKIISEQEAIKAYFCGHTHRNRVRYFSPCPEKPIAELAALKDFPGAYAEYLVYEDCLVQIHRRLASRPALSWSERCRVLYGGRYVDYAFGEIEDRCFVVRF